MKKPINKLQRLTGKTKISPRQLQIPITKEMEDNNKDKEEMQAFLESQIMKTVNSDDDKLKAVKEEFKEINDNLEDYKLGTSLAFSINTIIKNSPIDTSLISDGKKTFKQLYNRIEELEIERLEDTNGNISAETIAKVIINDNIDMVKLSNLIKVNYEIR